MSTLACTVALSGPIGCTSVCEGPGCEARYSGALVGVHDAAGIGTGQLDPLDATATLEGTAEQGADWGAALGPGVLLVGVPQTNTITQLSLDDGGALSFAPDQGNIQGAVASQQMGASLLVRADGNGGFASLLVGAPGSKHADDSINDGAVLVFEDLPAGLDRSVAPQEATKTIYGVEAGGRLGTDIFGCGDVDGDGTDDWATAAPLADGRANLAGRVVLVRSLDVDDVDGAILATDIDSTWFGTSTGARAGTGLDCRSDLDGDGYADLAAGVPFADTDVEAGGAVHVLAGGPKMETGGTSRLLADAATATFQGSVAEEWLGFSVATGDIDGDGKAELVAGAPGWLDQVGRVKMWTAEVQVRPGGSSTWALDDSLAATINGEQSPDSFGRTVAVRDLDGDGYAELLVGAPRYDPDSTSDTVGYDSGKLYSLPGDADRSWWSIGTQAEDVADPTWMRSQEYLRTGQWLSLGDYNSDGVDDLLLLHRTDPD